MLRNALLLFCSLLLQLPVSATPPSKGGKYTFSPTQSTLQWTIHKRGGGVHTGKIKLKDGSCAWNGSEVKSGTVVFDLTTITCEDQADSIVNAKLLATMNSETFFNTAANKTFSFEVKNCTEQSFSKYMMKINLQLNGTKQTLEFPITIREIGETLVLLGTITFDRKLFNMHYQAVSVLSDIGDKGIDDQFEFKFHGIAKLNKQ